MESSDFHDSHETSKFESNNEELDETILQELVDFMREAMGGKLAERTCTFKASQNVHQNHYWTYCIEEILEKNKHKNDSHHSNVHQSNYEENEDARAYHNGEELINEESTNTTRNANLSKKKKKNKKKKANKEKKGNLDEVDGE